ncbi:hypothetical protein DUNSADRAFT_15464, partial [Dunaliella salina]
MSDIIRSWLEESGLNPTKSIEEDFANGYMFGQLLHRYNLQPDFDKFEDRRAPESMVNNYTRLQVLFHALFFEDVMRTHIPDTSNQLMESMHVRKYQERQYRLEAKAQAGAREDQENALNKRDALRSSLQNKMAMQRVGQFHINTCMAYIRCHYLDSALHMLSGCPNHIISNMRTERQNIAGRMITKALSKCPVGAGLVYTDIGSNFKLAQRNLQLPTHASNRALPTYFFPRNLPERKRLNSSRPDAVLITPLNAKHTSNGVSPTHSHHALCSSSRRTTRTSRMRQPHELYANKRHVHLTEIKFCEDTRLEHQFNAAKQQHADLCKLTNARAVTIHPILLDLEHDAAVHAALLKHKDEVEKEELRVELALAETHKQKRLEELHHAALDVTHGIDTFEINMKRLLKGAAVRRARGPRSFITCRWADMSVKVMRENRLLREQQYAARRAQDWDDTLKRELEQHRSLRQQYEASAAAEKEAWLASERARKEAKAAKHRAMGERGNQQAELQLAKAAVADWLDCLGEYECQPPIGHNEALGAVVAELDSLARPKVAPSDLPQIQHLPLKICIVGTPFGGKSSMARDLAQRFKLRLLEPEVLVAEAITAAEEWAARPPGAEDPAVAAATGAQGQPEKTKSSAQEPAARDGNKKGGEAQPGGNADQQGGQAAEQQQQQQQQQQEPEAVPQKVQLGEKLKALLQEGKEVADDVLVPLVVLGMVESQHYTPAVEVDPKPKNPKRSPKGATKGAPPPEEPEPVPQGFIVDGFPRTEAQAVALERALTGLDLQAEQAVVEQASRVAPPPPEALPQVNRTLVSGLDAVIVLEVADFTIALKRALGRRLDPMTGKVYHLEFDPPPANDPGLVARLKELDDSSNDAVAVQQRLVAHAATARPMDEWHKRFSRLRRPVDGSGPVEEVLQVAADAAQGVLRAKAAVASCRAAVEAAVKARAAAEKAQDFAELARAHAEGAAQELLTAKKAEIQAAALLEGSPDVAGLTGTLSTAEQRKKDKKDKNAPPPDPAAVEVLKAQAAAKCAEQFKVCRGAAGDAGSYAERAKEASESAKAAVERARASLGDAEISAGAEVEARVGMAKLPFFHCFELLSPLQIAITYFKLVFVCAGAEVEAREAAGTAESARGAASEAASKAEVAKAAAQVAAKEAEKFSTVDSLPPDAKVELSPPAEAPSAGEAAEAPKDDAAVVPVKRVDIHTRVAIAMIKVSCKAGAFPQAVTALGPKCSHLCTAIKLALAAGNAVMTSLQPEPESDLRGAKGRQAAGGGNKRRGTPERKRDPKGNSRGGAGGTETPEGAEDVVPPEVEDAVAAELLAL